MKVNQNKKQKRTRVTKKISIFFQGMFKTETINAPMRLCYHRLCHYNSIVDPVKPTIGVGLGLPGHSPGSADRNQVKQAVKNSEADLVEKAMLEDKIKATGKKRRKK